MLTLTKEALTALTPADALGLLKEGHARFTTKQAGNADLHGQISATSNGQNPFAVILGCVDSRVPHELIFDLGIGDVFSIRIAGNFINDDILGSMEFACKVVGSKHILVLGHTSCGAIKGAISDVKLGNLTQLLDKLKPAINAAEAGAHADEIAQKNVQLTVASITERSPILKGLVDRGDLTISGAMYDVGSGTVTFDVA